MEIKDLFNKIMATDNIISIALGRTTFEMELMKSPVLSEIITQMPRLPFEEIKREEMYLHNDENKLKQIKNGKEREMDPTVNVSEKYIYINRVLNALADNLGSGIADIYGEFISVH